LFSIICLNKGPDPSTSVGEISQVHYCHTRTRSPTKVSHNIDCANMTRDKARAPERVGHPHGLAESPLARLDPHLLLEQWYVHPLPLYSP
jgi:hypothetical protein